MRQHCGLANLVTSLSISAGYVALLVGSSQVGLAAALVVLAATLDGIDGPLARRAGGDRTFGAQLDSLADLLCFCVVPASTLYHVTGDQPRLIAALASALVVLTGAWRLARFPLVQAQGYFVGLPTPAAGCLLMLLLVVAPAPVALVGAAVLSALMVSTIRFPSASRAVARVRPGRRAHALRLRFHRQGTPTPRIPGRGRGHRSPRSAPRRQRGKRASRVLAGLHRPGRR